MTAKVRHTKHEIAACAEMARKHSLDVRLCPDGSVIFSPPYKAALDGGKYLPAQSKNLDEWRQKNEAQNNGRS